MKAPTLLSHTAVVWFRFGAYSIAVPFVSSTSSIGGFSPRQQCLGLFSGRGALRCATGMMRRRNEPTWRPPMAGTRRSPEKQEEDRAGGLTLSDYLQKILTARVYDVAHETPLELARSLSRRARQPGPAQARGQPAGVQLQAARRLQQDGAPERRAAQARRDLRLGRQPRAGRGARRTAARLPRAGRDAGDHAAAEDRRGACARRRGRAARRQLLGRLSARASNSSASRA